MPSACASHEHQKAQNATWCLKIAARLGIAFERLIGSRLLPLTSSMKATCRCCSVEWFSPHPRLSRHVIHAPSHPAAAAMSRDLGGTGRPCPILHGTASNGLRQLKKTSP